MKISILPILILSLLINSCIENRVRKKPPVPSSPDELITGCYYMTDDSTGLERPLVNSDGEVSYYYINPEPIFTVGDFKKIRLTKEGQVSSLGITLNEKGSKAFAIATKKNNEKDLAFIIYNELVIVPRVKGEITNGALQISGAYEEGKYERFLKQIDSEMYEQ